MPRWHLSAVVLLCVAPLHSFASGSPISPSVNAVTLAHPHEGVAADTIARAAKDFARLNPNRAVHIRQVGWGKLLQELNGNTSGADITTVGSTWASHLLDTQKLTPLTELLEGWRRRRGRRGDITRDFVRYLDYTYMFPAGAGSKPSALPEWHALPMDVEARVLYYRKDLFLKHLGLRCGPYTLDEAISLGRDIEEKERAAGNPAMRGFAVSIGGGDSDVMATMASFVMGNGSSFIGPDESCTFTTDEFQGALGTYAGLGPDWMQAGSSDDLAQRFGEGNLAMMISATWMKWRIMNHGLNASLLSAAPLPAGPVGPFNFQGGSGWAIPTWVPEGRRQAAWDFIEFLMEPSGPYLKDLTLGNGMIPAYESVTQRAKLEAGDTLQLRGFELIGSGVRGAPIDMAEASFRAVGGAVQGYPVENLGSERPDDVWRVPAAQAGFTVTFRQAVTVSHYSMLIAADWMEWDPTAWVLEGQAGNGTWVVLDDSPDHHRMYRSSTAGPYPLWGNFTGTTFRWTAVATRGTLCDNICAVTVDQLAFAVPLHYPQLGFYKMGRVEANQTVTRMVRRVADLGMSPVAAAEQACEELRAVLHDDLEELDAEESGWVLAVVAGCAAAVVVMAVGTVWHRTRYTAKTSEEISRLKNNNEMAEDLAAAVAVLDLDAVEYLFVLPRPNRIQQAFITIVTNLKEFKAYMPATLLVDSGESSDGFCSSGVSRLELSIKSSVHSSPDRPSSGRGFNADEPSCGTPAVSHSLAAKAKNAIVTSVSLTRKRCTFVVANAKSFHKMLLSSNDRASIDAHTAYVSALLSACTSLGGVAEAFQGDRMLCSFNTARLCARHVGNACHAALLMHSQSPLPVSVAVSTGSAKVGNLGSDTMRKYTFLSPVVPWVHALERYSRRAGGGVLTDHYVQKEAMGEFAYRSLDRVVFPKRSNGAGYITVMELHGKDAEDVEWMYQLEARDTEHDWNDWALAVFENDWEAEEPLRTHAGHLLGSDAPPAYARLCAAAQRKVYSPTEIAFH